MIAERDRIFFEPPLLGCKLYLTGLPRSGNTLLDRSAYGNHSTIVSATRANLPSGGQYLSFDGTDDYVNCGTWSISGSKLTILAWFKVSANGDYGLVIKDTTVAGQRSFLLYLAADGTIMNQVITSVGNVQKSITITYNDNKWHQAGLRYDGAYIDGFFDGEYKAQGAQTGDIVENTASVYIGARAAAIPDLFMNGSIGFPIHIYQRALTRLEIKRIYQREKNILGA